MIIPIAKKRVLEQAHDFAWIHTHGRPAWGPGRDGPFNLTKFNLLDLPDDDTVDNADFPSIWNAGLRENTSLNWAGETQDPLAVYIDSALGIGAPPATVGDDMLKHRDYLRAKQPPPYPFPIDAALAAQGEAVWAANCAECHAPGGARFGRTVPIDEIGTDRERFDTWTQANADATNAKARELGVERKAMVKDVGYASQPLDGIWLRAPYLHNGSVPSLTALLAPPDQRPAASGAAATSTTPSRSASAAPPPDDDCPRLFPLETTERGNGNAGHRYGTDLPACRQGGPDRIPQDPLKATERRSPGPPPAAAAVRPTPPVGGKRRVTRPRANPYRPRRLAASANPHRLTVTTLMTSGGISAAPSPFLMISYRQKPYRAVAGAPATAGEKLSTQRAKPASAGGRPQRRPTAKRRPSGGFMPPEAGAPPRNAGREPDAAENHAHALWIRCARAVHADNGAISDPYGPDASGAQRSPAT